MTDPTLERANWSEAQLDAYAAAAARLCHCEGTCTCGWDDPGSLAMQRIEREDFYLINDDEADRR